MFNCKYVVSLVEYASECYNFSIVYVCEEDIMKLVRQVVIVILLMVIGEMLNKTFDILVPGNIIGMILLLVALELKVIKLEMVEEFGQFLLGHLAIFLIPSCVGIIAVTGILEGKLLIFTFIALATTLIVMAVTAITVTLLKKVTS